MAAYISPKSNCLSDEIDNVYRTAKDTTIESFVRNVFQPLFRLIEVQRLHAFFLLRKQRAP